MKMIGAFLLFFGPALAFAQEGYLENPQPDATESGIGAISGWHCTAQNITVLIDGNSLGKAGSGTSRRDVAGICGRSDTGFSLLFNYNVLSQGPHTIRVYADGNVLAERQFKSVKSGRQEFLAGVNKSLNVPEFPSAGVVTTLTWSESKQSFVVTCATFATANDDPIFSNAEAQGGVCAARCVAEGGNFTGQWWGSAPGKSVCQCRTC
jgi:hypothetical protein